jgi:hypothetical protein
MEDETQADETINSSVDENNEEETQEEESQEQSQDDDSDLEALKAELEKERKARQQLTARAKKAEADLLASKKSQSKTSASASPDVDERILKANGMSDELLKELKVISKVRGVPLIDAQSDPVFKAIKDNYEKDQASNEASLGASKGSGPSKPKKTPNTPGISRDEHKEMFKKMVG